MDIYLEIWEWNMILNMLSEEPYHEVAATIQRIKDQMEGKA